MLHASLKRVPGSSSKPTFIAAVGSDSRQNFERNHIGGVLRELHPLSEFPLQSSATHSALVGGGVGIAPLHSMAAELWSQGTGFEL